jgi:hypothetical protein
MQTWGFQYKTGGPRICKAAYPSGFKPTIAIVTYLTIAAACWIRTIQASFRALLQSFGDRVKMS